MPKQQLSGTLDEQLAAIYEVVEQRMAEGKYSGAVHYAKEIIKHDPNYRDIQAILKKAKHEQREQQLLLVVSLTTAILTVVITRWMGWTADWQSLIMAFVGGLLGFLVTNWWIQRRPKPAP